MEKRGAESLPDLCYPYYLRFGDSSHTCLGTQGILQSQVKCLFKKIVPNAVLNVVNSQKEEYPRGCQWVGDNHCAAFTARESSRQVFLWMEQGDVIFPLEMEILVKVRAVHANEKYSP